MYDMPGSSEKGLEGVIDVGGPTKAVLSRAFSDFYSYSGVSELYICCLLLEPLNVSENLSTLVQLLLYILTIPQVQNYTHTTYNNNDPVVACNCNHTLHNRLMKTSSRQGKMETCST